MLRGQWMIGGGGKTNQQIWCMQPCVGGVCLLSTRIIIAVFHLIQRGKETTW